MRLTSVCGRLFTDKDSNYARAKAQPRLRPPIYSPSEKKVTFIAADQGSGSEQGHGRQPDPRTAATKRHDPLAQPGAGMPPINESAWPVGSPSRAA